MKICTQCNNEKNDREFYKDRTKPDGHRPSCKSCIDSQIKNKRLTDSVFRENKRLIARKSTQKNRKNDYENKRDKENVYRRNRYKNDELYRKDVIKQSSKYKSKKRKEDPVSRAIDNARSRAKKLLDRKTNSFSTFLHCTRDEFKAHIESQFQEGMTWDNYGQWHIDHKYPLSKAIKEGKESFENACKYTNIQPLWAIDNILKSNKTNNL